MKKALLILLLASTTSFADETVELYAALDQSVGGGYLTLTEEPCEISKVATQYIFKA